jgi:hypothetical protein
MHMTRETDYYLNERCLLLACDEASAWPAV